MTTPLLIISDAISAPTGLARIARDLSTRVHEHLGDVYRVGTAGYGGAGSRKFPFPQYHIEKDEWIILNLPDIVKDFAGSERCKVLFIWDLHRISWFSQPEQLGSESLAKYPELKNWLLKANIEKWCYVPLDSTGPNDRLSFPIALTALGFDRLLAYGPFGESLLRRTIGDDEANKRNLTNLPHGIDLSVFYECHRKVSRNSFLHLTEALPLLAMLGRNSIVKPIAQDEILVGCVCTNQARKNLDLACETIALLARDYKIRFWLHTDTLERAWSIPSLLIDYGILDRTLISLGFLPDYKMAAGYSACNITLGVGSEGWGLPLAESLACGTPVIHTSYAGGADIVPREMQVDPIAFYKEGSYSSMRPVYRAEDWAAKALGWTGRRASLDPKYDWKNNWIGWEKWFREGIA